MPVVAGDTAGAARELAERPTPPSRDRPAARGRTLWARDPAEDIEDEDHNTTRFVVLARPRTGAAAEPARVVTSFVFNVRNIPAALYKALGGFATNGVNMTKLESYMVEGDFTATSSSPRSTATPRTST